MEQTKTFGESTGLVLRKIIMLAWFFLPLLIILGLLFIGLLLPAEEPIPVEIVDSNCTIVNYYEYLDETACSLEIEFNQYVYDGYVIVEFFDAGGKSLGQTEVEVTSYYYDCVLDNTYFTVDGEVDSYEIVSFADIESAEDDAAAEDADFFMAFVWLWAILRLIYVAPLTITALFFSCKTYRIGGYFIVVYAGRMHHYIKIDGKKYDEKNPLISFSSITLNAVLESDDRIEVYITGLTKRISLRLNGVLEAPEL